MTAKTASKKPAAAKGAEDLLGTPGDKTKKAAAKAPAKDKAAAKAPAKGKDAEDLLGTPSKAAAKDKAAKTAKEPAEPKVKRVKEPVKFAEGEREKIAGDVKKAIRGKTDGVNSKTLAEKLGIATRKLRPVLYKMQKAGDVTLKLAASKVLGMTVIPAAKPAA